MYASFSSALTTRKERSGESGSKPKWRKTTTRGEMVSHGERREYGRSRERGGGEGGSLQREGDVVSSRPVDEMATAHPSPTVRVFPRFGCRFFRRIFSLLFKERRFPNPPPPRRRPLVPASVQPSRRIASPSVHNLRNLTVCHGVVSSPAALSRGFLLPASTLLLRSPPLRPSRSFAAFPPPIDHPPSHRAIFHNSKSNLKSQTIFFLV